MLLALGPHRFDVTHRALVAGLLHETSRSPEADGDRFLAEAEALVGAGADCLHIGSPGAAATGAEPSEVEELDRLARAVQALRDRVAVPISVATSRASVARACFAEGAVVVDDASGFADPDYLAAAARAGATVVATHGGRRPGEADSDPSGGDVVAEVASFLAERVRRAEAAGIPAERILVDAGLGIGKTGEESTRLLRHHDRLSVLGAVLCSTASTASFLDDLPGAEPGDRELGVDAAHALGIVQGVRVLRTREVRAARRVADTMARLLEARAAAHAERRCDGGAGVR